MRRMTQAAADVRATLVEDARVVPEPGFPAFVRIDVVTATGEACTLRFAGPHAHRISDDLLRAVAAIAGRRVASLDEGAT